MEMERYKSSQSYFSITQHCKKDKSDYMADFVAKLLLIQAKFVYSATINIIRRQSGVRKAVVSDDHLHIFTQFRHRTNSSSVQGITLIKIKIS